MRISSRPLLTVAFVLFIVASANGQATLKYAALGDFRLENGQTIRNCRVGYRTFGQLNQDKSNAILFPTWFNGTTEQLIGQIGPGKLVDSTKYFVIAVDALGNGVSSSPSNSPSQRGASFPQFSIRDMVNAQHRLVTEVLRLERLYAVIGISMGGMQAFQWIVTYPEFVGRAIPIVGTPRQTSYDLLLWNTQLRVIEALRHSQGGENMAMQLLPLVSALAIDTPQYRVSQTRPEEFQAYLAARMKEQAGRNVYDWASQLRAMIGHDIYKPFGGSAERTAAAVRAHALIIVAEQDHMVNPTPALELAKLLKAETLVLSSDCGHMAPVCEPEKVRTAIARFLEQ